MQNIRSPILVWAVLLFFGFDLVNELTVYLSTQFFGINWDQFSTSLWIPNTFYLFYIAIRAVLYPFVRRLGHHMLAQVWLYTVIVSAIGGVAGLVQSPFYSADMGMWAFGISIIPRIVSLIILVWFARKASIISFRHSLLLIGLVAAMQSPGSFIPSHILAGESFVLVQPISIYIAMLIGQILVGGLAVRSLVNDQIVVSSTRSVLPPTIAMVLLTTALSGASIIWEPVHVPDLIVPVLYAGIGFLIFYALAVAITYAVRVRKG